MRRMAVVAAVAGLLLVELACDEPTSIAVHASATLPCEALKGTSITVMTAGTLDGPSVQSDRCVTAADASTIGTLIVVPQGATDARITVRVVAGVDRRVGECTARDNYAGCIVARRTLRFAPGHEIDLPISLRAECKDVGCDGLSTCVRGECRSARVTDPSTCYGTACGEESLEATPSRSADGGGDAARNPDGGASCGVSEKRCGDVCVSTTDPAFGCDKTGCSPCEGSGSGEYACVAGACRLLQCKADTKRCGETCVASDIPALGCAAAGCSPCDTAHGRASCTSAGACAIECDAGYKLCGGRCVNVDDPTYGCGPTTCDETPCPTPGAGATLVCENGTCAVGTCPAGTKECSQRCVPTDTTHGCQEAGRCGACPAGHVCSGAPSVCTCVAEPLSKTCTGKACGPAVNNCGTPVTCPSTCAAPKVCGGGGAGDNNCGCNAESLAATCNGKDCGPAVNNCGTPVTCPSSCVAPAYCGGGGVANRCGCIPLVCSGSCGCFDDGCGGQCCDSSGCGGGGP